MGCGPSSVDSPPAEAAKSELEQTLGATMLIQRWYRRYKARIEAQRRCTWKIFQSMEYAGEQSQLKLYNFFNDLMTSVETEDSAKPDNNLAAKSSSSGLLNALNNIQRRRSTLVAEDVELMKATHPGDVHIDMETYTGPHIKIPITSAQLDTLSTAFKQKQLLHAKYVLLLLHEARRRFKHMPNINRATTQDSNQITVCGDLHGKLDDLFVIFYKNGYPSPTNPYVFNGDFVDRGPQSVEVAMMLFACLLVSPGHVHINRGNHEDHIMNLRSHTPADHPAIFICHGGISSKTDLAKLKQIDRHKYLSVLRPPLMEEEEEGIEPDKQDLMEWRQVLDILWSDPKPQPGCFPNTFRGGGSYWGPDITKQILHAEGLQLLIRSHECKPEGYEYHHNKQVLTVFSASNYYEEGSNKGAYVKLDRSLEPRAIQYMASKSHIGNKLSIKQRQSALDDSAMHVLQEKILANRTALMAKFEALDPNDKGVISISDWCDVMQEVLQMDLPWRNILHRLVREALNNQVYYKSTFDQFTIQNKLGGKSESITEAMYRHKDILETIFRAIDKDHSGTITYDEFYEACTILNKHSKLSLTEESIKDMVKAMDQNNDNVIDFNEFLEAFRLVDQFGNEQKRKSVELEGKGSVANLRPINSPPSEANNASAHNSNLVHFEADVITEATPVKSRAAHRARDNSAKRTPRSPDGPTAKVSKAEVHATPESPQEH